MIQAFRDSLERSIDLRPLALFRVGLGLIIIVHILDWGPHLTELFSNQGFQIGPWASWAPSPHQCLVLMTILLMSTLLMTVGVWTRWTTAITLVIFAFFYQIDSINEKVLYSMILTSLIIGLLSPWGRYLSVWNTVTGASQPEVAEYLGNPLFIRLWQLSLIQMYFFAGLIKTRNELWLNGEVLRQIFMGRASSPTGLWLSGVLPDGLYPLLTLGTILLELLLPFLLIFTRTRFLGVILGVSFHLGIEVSLQIGPLGLYSILLLVLFFWPEGRWDYRPRLYALIENVGKISEKHSTIEQANH